MATPISGSAQDQKAVFGETTDNQQQAQPSGSGGSTFTVGGDGIRPVKGASTLVKEVKDKNGNWVTMDFWNNVIKTADVKVLTTILSESKLNKEYDMTLFIRGIEYQGFDRLFYIKHALSLMSVSVFSRFAIIGALRGSNFEKIKDSCENMPADLPSSFTTVGFVKTPKKRKDITILRNTASIPHWCVYWFRKAGVDKKIPGSDCPAELQFPGAASLPMSREVRMQHIEFCYQFSQLLPGGKFNLNIYMVAMKNMIPVSEIPMETMELLKVASVSEAYMLKDEDAQKYDQTKQVVRR